MSVLNFIFFCFLLFVTSGRRGRSSRFPHSTRHRLQERTQFTGRKEHLDRGDDLTPPKSLDDKTDEELADELSMLEVHRNGVQILIQRSPDDIKYLRDFYKNINSDITPSTDDNDNDNDNRRLTDLGDNEQTITSPASFTFAKHTGRLTYTANSQTFVCTGILVGDKYVLTAAHCLHEGNGGDWYGNINFYPRQTASSTPTAINWNRARIFNGWINNDETNLCDRTYDIGIIELDNSAGLGNAAWGWSNNIANGQNMGLYGYKNAGTAMVHTWGTISNLATETFRSPDNSAYGGQSGSGIYVEDGSTAINGVQVSGCPSWNGVTRITAWKKDSFNEFMS